MKKTLLIATLLLISLMIICVDPSKEVLSSKSSEPLTPSMILSARDKLYGKANASLINSNRQNILLGPTWSALSNERNANQVH
jgi:hypothetical protein